MIPVGTRQLAGSLVLPERPRGIILFAHGSGSSRYSPRNRAVAEALNQVGFATLLMDLLEVAEESDRDNVFDVSLLADRLVAALDWVLANPETRGLPIGLFGASTGSAAALRAAARRPGQVSAVVSRGGRPDLAWDELPAVRAPTLLLVGEADEPVLTWNRECLPHLAGFRELVVIAGATHLFPEPGALDEVARQARDWFARYVPGSSTAGRLSPADQREG